MARHTVTEEEAKSLFVRQLNELRARGAEPGSEARLAAIFAKSEEDCRALEARQAEDQRRAAALPQR